jgi:hypothetical protein
MTSPRRVGRAVLRSEPLRGRGGYPLGPMPPLHGLQRRAGRAFDVVRSYTVADVGDCVRVSSLEEGRGLDGEGGGLAGDPGAPRPSSAPSSLAPSGDRGPDRVVAIRSADQIHRNTRGRCSSHKVHGRPPHASPFPAQVDQLPSASPPADARLMSPD